MVTMAVPGETEAGNAGMHPCRGIAWWAHRDDDRSAEALPRSSKNQIGSVDPDALKIPARRAEFTLTENARVPFHAEPRQFQLASLRNPGRKAVNRVCEGRALAVKKPFSLGCRDSGVVYNLGVGGRRNGCYSWSGGVVGGANAGVQYLVSRKTLN